MSSSPITQRSNSKLRTMSEPVPLLHPTLDPLASRGWISLLMDSSPPCDFFPQTGLHNEDVIQETECISEQSSEETKNRTRCASLTCRQEAKKVVLVGVRDSFNQLPSLGSLSEDPRNVKHKSSAIVFCNQDLAFKDQTTLKESSDRRGSSSPTTEDGERQDNNDEDDFSQASQHKEFLVSRRRRVQSRNRKSLRKRLDGLPKGTMASGCQRKVASEARPEVTVDPEEKEAGQNNRKQVREKKIRLEGLKTATIII